MLGRIPPIRIHILLLLLSFSIVPSRAWAQAGMADLDRATRAVDVSPREDAEKKLIKAPRKPAGPKEEIPEVPLTGPKLFIKTIRLEGNETYPEKDFRPILEKFENREVYETELKESLTGQITREYLKRGVIATSFIPPQEIKEGVVTLRVIEAKMGDLEITKAHFYPKERLRYYWAIPPGKVIRYNTMSRSLQFMNKNPDREVKATLLPGTKPGTTNVALTQKTYPPIHFTYSLDNEGAVPTGKMRTGYGGVENNLLGLDDILLAGYTGGKDFGGVYIYHKVPITPFGTAIMYGFSKSRAFPKKDFQQYDISSNAETASAFIYQDLYHEDDYIGELSAGLDAKNKRSVAESSGLPPGFAVTPGSTGDLNVDRLRIIRFAGALVDRSANSMAYIKPEFSQGLNFLGARRKNEFSSRQAENTFSKLGLNAQYLYRFKSNIQMQARFSGQAASEKLTPQEELFMGGIDSVRGYPDGDYLADTGFAANLELLVPPMFLPDYVRLPYGEHPLKDELTGVLFFDYGWGSKRGMIQGEQTEDRMASIGAGIRIKLFNQALLRLEWGIPLDPLVNRPITESGGNRPRLHFSLSFQDQLPRELERLSKEVKKSPNPIKYYTRLRENELAARKAAEEASKSAAAAKEGGTESAAGQKTNKTN